MSLKRIEYMETRQKWTKDSKRFLTLVTLWFLLVFGSMLLGCGGLSKAELTPVSVEWLRQAYVHNMLASIKTDPYVTNSSGIDNSTEILDKLQAMALETYPDGEYARCWRTGKFKGWKCYGICHFGAGSWNVFKKESENDNSD